MGVTVKSLMSANAALQCGPVEGELQQCSRGLVQDALALSRTPTVLKLAES